MLPTPFLLFSFFSVLSVTLSRPKMTFESKAASELNISFIFLPSHRHMHIYIYIPIHICVYEYIHTCIYIYISSKRKRRKEEEKKKNRSIYVHRNRPCMCVYMCVCMYVWIGGPFFSSFSFFFLFRNRLEQTDKRLLSPSLRWMLLTLEEQHLSDSWSSTENARVFSLVFEHHLCCSIMFTSNKKIEKNFLRIFLINENHLRKSFVNFVFIQSIGIFLQLS